MPIIVGLSTAGHGVVAALQERLTNVAGLATTFFFEPLNSIVRFETEVFNNEPSFRVASNFRQLTTGFKPCLQGDPNNSCSTFDKINMIRGELGVDRNLFIRPLNPSNSFIWVNAIVYEANPNNTQFKVYRSAGLIKPSAIAREKAGGAPAGSVIGSCDGKNPGQGCDFVRQSDFNFFVQSHIETTYMHGKLSPPDVGGEQLRQHRDLPRHLATG